MMTSVTGPILFFAWKCIHETLVAYCQSYDFEYLLLRDDILMEENGQDALNRRERDIYLQKIVPAAEGEGELTQSFLLHSWLKVRQQQETEQTDGIVLPGRVWSELYRISWLVLLLGLTSGAGLAFSFLGYSGAEPVNVSVYLEIFLGLQILSIGLMVRGMLRLNRYRYNFYTD